ncbi:MAG: S-layer homology domain-containing protein, partial [Synergistaceae bacterium]|nr:S-layer homology domain-containing protein [Synergistaceae bacterium]
MKKFVAFLAVVALLAVAAPVFAATNPFMDVPMNSWAYDAVAQLASKGILSGYPDGLYKGRQPMTRYEAASMVARALAYVDMTKASRQDVDMLKRLVIEFKDELDALGVTVDGLSKDMALFKRRLNGWQIGGRIRFDMDHRMSDGLNSVGYPDSMGNAGMG